ncbi:exopolysaccharide biosynthesis protein [Azospirillum sp. B510]|uniref:exopolysaccharide biosynthesis protein n=1 Tax=Azospirillum sp. (strain B510) TaxID=137722 RepID=UPI001FFE7E41|nr:exopolysaccharide biosynthesis protein [Azospirillum sp. B510]
MDWLTGRPGDRSFGIILLLLALLGALPGVSVLAGVLLMIVAFQMMMDRSGPMFPRRISGRYTGTRRFAAMISRTVPVLRYLEQFIRPRWATPFTATKRMVGGVVLLLGASLLVPVPLSNLPPAILIVLIAFAYLEEDGALLCTALGGAFLLSAIAVGAAWEATGVAGWRPGFP